MNSTRWGGGLSYAEKQHLEKTLDVAFIDEELAKMRKQFRFFERVTRWAFVPLAVVSVVILVWGLLSEGLSSDLVPLLLSPFYFIGPFLGRRSLRRKIWIYEALRELSDADEMDVTLSRAARDADALIRQLVERELDIEQRRPARPATRTK